MMALLHLTQLQRACGHSMRMLAEQPGSCIWAWCTAAVGAVAGAADEIGVGAAAAAALERACLLLPV